MGRKRWEEEGGGIMNKTSGLDIGVLRGYGDPEGTWALRRYRGAEGNRGTNGQEQNRG